jgi:hypothetical protein
MEQPGYREYPDEPAPFGYDERLSKDCKEPKNRPHSFNGAGPPVIYCCRTAQAKLKDFEDRQQHCDDDPPVPCWKSLMKALPTYMMYYKSRVADLCGTTTTTTTTTVAPNKTDSDDGEEESIVKDVTGNVSHRDSLAERFTAFCLRKCDALTVKHETKTCDAFCGVMTERHREDMGQLHDEFSGEEGGDAETAAEEPPAGKGNATTEAESDGNKSSKTEAGNSSK